MVVLYNKKNKEQLINQLDAEKFNRLTISFYKYVLLKELSELRDMLKAVGVTPEKEVITY